MIWNSIPLMTTIDIIMLIVIGVAAWKSVLGQARSSVPDARKGRLAILTGLVLIALFYAIDFATMHVFPAFIAPSDAMALMRDLHLEYNWFILTVSVIIIVYGFLTVTRTEIALARQRDTIQANLTDAQRIARIGSWSWDIVNGSLHWSDEIYRIFGLSPHEFTATYEAFIDSIHPGDRQVVKDAVQHCLETGEPYSIEHRIVLPDGSEKTVHEQGETAFGPNGNPLVMTGTVQDITEHKQAEEQIKKTEARLSEIMEIAPEAIIAADEDMKIRFFNQGAERIFGYRADEVLLRHIDILMPEYFREDHRRHVEGFDRSDDTYRLMDRRQEILGLKKDGTEFPASASVSKLEMGGEKIFTLMLQDITERKHTQDALLSAKAEAETANRAKSEFLASMSHELRTPLNAILGFADIISNQYFGAIDEKYKEYAEDIGASGEHLLLLVNEILDLSAIEAGNKSLTKELLSTEEIMAECERIIEDKARINGIDLETKFSKDLPPLYADKQATKQILLNLLSNAVKFTPKGGKITVSAKAAKQNMTLMVADTGKGILPEKLSILTDPFTKTEADPYVAEQGWGLGLTITKSLVDLHDGSLDIQSKVGKGTTVTVTLPNGG